MSVPQLSLPPLVDRLQKGALVVGSAGLLVCVLGGAFQPEQFLRSYLFAYLFWLGLAIGCLSILMLHHLTGGMWGLIVRRIFEAAVRTLPLLALLFLPVALGLPRLYVWAGPLPQDKAFAALLEHKAPYLNVPFFLARAVFYFSVWLSIGYFLNRWSLELDKGENRGVSRRLRSLSAGGLVLMGLTITFSSFDWAMSLDPRWFSTIYGVIFMVGQAVSAFAFALLLLALLGQEKPFAQVTQPSFVHDLGKLLLAFVMLWTYMHLSQFLIIWSGNLPEEVIWYVRRLRGGWQFVGFALVLFQFALPFVLLLSRGLKRNARLMGYLAGGLLVMRVVELFWLVKPEFPGEEGLSVHFLDLAATLGIGGIWLFVFAHQLKGRPPLPVGEPEIRALLEGA
jgi:hypothetical protein